MGPDSIQNTLVYIILFIATYVEVFLFITLFEFLRKVKREDVLIQQKPAYYPSVTIIVPCYNEQNTVEGTIKSLLALEYPKDKLNLIIVDDGSKDNTWQFIQKFKNHPQISIYHKENGGKYTALNWALERTTTELVGCLDADSFVDSKALRYMVHHFVRPEVMAVTPAIKIYKPQTTIQAIQYIEYQIGMVIKKLYSLLNAIHVTPGPFTIFRKDVFNKIGLFRHAHNTEDMEIAIRMHTHNMKIENCHYASVYTVGPRTLKALYKQRVRWTHGFLENAIDYKHMLFNPRYGNISWFTLPSAFASLLSLLILVTLSIWGISKSLYLFIQKTSTVGLHFNWNFDFNWFYINTQTSILVTGLLLIMTIIFLLQGRKLAEGRYTISKETFYFLFLYPYIVPLWVITSFYNTALKRKSTWR